MYSRYFNHGRLYRDVHALIHSFQSKYQYNAYYENYYFTERQMYLNKSQLCTRLNLKIQIRPTIN